MVKGFKLLMVAAVALLSAHQIAFAGPVASCFDTDAEGWNSSGDVHGFGWISDKGSPAGSIHAIDDTTGATWYFIAPSNFLGNQSGAYGQTLSYDINISNRDSAPWTSMPDIAITGGGITLSYFGNFLPVVNNWSTFSVVLDEGSGWKVGNTTATGEQIKSALGNMTSLQIRGEYMTGNDNAYLDNVVMNVVPEPSAVLPLLTGALGIACTIRRKR